MCPIASLFLLQRPKGSMSDDARDFNNMETRAVINSPHPARQGAEGNSRHSDRNMHHRMTVKKWVAQFKHGDFPTCDAPRPGRPKTVTTPEIIDKIHKLILEGRRISARSIAEQLGISCERVGSIIHEVLDMRKLSANWVPKCLNADQKLQRCQSSEQLLEFFRRDPNDFLSRLVTMDETWFITMTRRQSNNQWNGGIAAPPAPKNSDCKNPLEKFSLRFFGIKKASTSLIIFQRAKPSTRSITDLCWCN